MQYFNLHTHTFTNHPQTLELVNQYPWTFDNTIPYYSIGIHPWYINEQRLQNDLRIIQEKIQLKNCLALGECGLDKRIDISLALQQSVFQQHINLAETFRKPLILHLVAAFDELIAIKKSQSISVPIVIHGFSKNKQLAKQLLDQGFYLSFGKYLLRNPELKTVFQFVPDDSFFLETDTIEEPLQKVYEIAANYKKISMYDLQEQINQNFKKVFLKNQE